MLVMKFINSSGLAFEATDKELVIGKTSPLEYIKYCLDRGSILVALDVVVG